MAVSVRQKRFYDKYFWCSVCQKWIPKQKAIKLKNGYYCPYCKKKLRTRSWKFGSVLLNSLFLFGFFFVSILLFVYLFQNLLYCDSFLCVILNISYLIPAITFFIIIIVLMKNANRIHPVI